MFSNIREDLRRSYFRPVWLWRLPLRFITTRGFRAVALYRCARRLRKMHIPLLPRLVTVMNEGMHSVAIHPDADIGPGLTLPHAFGVVIGSGVKIGARAQIFHNAGLGSTHGQGFPRVGDDFIAFAGAQVVGPIALGDRVTIGANCTVIVDVESDSTVAQGRILVLKRKTQTDGEGS